MLFVKIINVLYVGFRSALTAFYKIPRQAKSFEGSYIINVFKLIIDQIFREVGSIWHFLLKNRKYKKKLEIFGNYKLLPEYVSSNPIIYSCGIAQNISFDKTISEKFNCDVFMFDPTKKSYEFMSTNLNPKLKFYNLGVWTEDGNIKFYHPNNPENVDVSATNFFKSETFIVLPCKSIPTIMKENNHSKIDVLKMDIEGGAFKVLDHILDHKIYPKQLIVELERPFFIYKANLVDLFNYFLKRNKIRSKLKKANYELIDLKANELLALRLH